MAKRIERLFVKMMSAGKCILKKLNIIKKHSTKSRSCHCCCHKNANVLSSNLQNQENRKSSITSHPSISTIDDLGFRCSLDTIYTLIDDDCSSFKETLDNLYNEKMENQYSV